MLLPLLPSFSNILLFRQEIPLFSYPLCLPRPPWLTFSPPPPPSPLDVPSFIKSPDDQTGISGGVASFVCQAAGDPRPRITWMKKGKKVSSQRFEVEFSWKQSHLPEWGSACADLYLLPFTSHFLCSVLKMD